MNLRTAAARIIHKVLSGDSLSDCLPEIVARVAQPRDQALLQAMCYGVCRRYYYLEALLDTLLNKPIHADDDDIFALMLVGLYQLTDMRVPDYAAVAETVEAAEDFKKPWFKSLINAVLRNFQRRRAELEKALADNVEAHYSHPAWFIGKIKKAWPQHWQAILEANNQHPPLSLRVNQQKLSRADYLEKLTAEDIAAEIIPNTATGITLLEPRDIKTLPGFMVGEVSVQDGAAQLAAELLQLQPGLRVLDACAAPGGKTAHIAEIQSDLAALVAVDHDPLRLQSVSENLKRLNLAAKCMASDVGDVKKWWDGEQFDRILLDAPCTASGVIRRHPDIKLLRRPEDVQQLAAEQLRLLTALWPLLKNGGVLLYAVCSVFSEESSKVLAQFLAAQADAKQDKIVADWGIDCPIGKQILPGMQGMDGFYYARLRKE